MVIFYSFLYVYQRVDLGLVGEGHHVTVVSQGRFSERSLFFFCKARGLPTPKCWRELNHLISIIIYTTL